MILHIRVMKDVYQQILIAKIILITKLHAVITLDFQSIQSVAVATAAIETDYQHSLQGGISQNKQCSTLTLLKAECVVYDLKEEERNQPFSIDVGGFRVLRIDKRTGRKLWSFKPDDQDSGVPVHFPRKPLSSFISIDFDHMKLNSRYYTSRRGSIIWEYSY